MSFSFATPQQQQPQSLFSSPQQPQQNFQSSSPFFSQPQQQQLQFPQQSPQLQQQQPPQPQPQNQLFLFTNDKAPASYGTKWADLHPDSQKFLLNVEERILEYRDESQRLDQCGRLYDSSVSSDGFEIDASHIVQELGGITTAMERQKAQLQELMTVVKDMLRNTEVAVHSFMILRPRFHANTGSASNANAPSQTSGATANPGSSAASSVVPVYDFYHGMPKKPSPFLQHTIKRFEKYLAECRQWIEELEQLLLLDSDRNNTNNRYTLLQSLPKVMTNVHDFFVHVAAKVEGIHQYIQSMKAAYIADQRRRGEGNDPFLEADRRETAKQEAAAKRVHPTLHLPANSQPSTQVSGLLTTSSATPGVTAVAQTSTAMTSASSGGGLSLFSTPSAAPSSVPSSLFATPTAAASQSSLFSSSSGSLFGSASTPSLFGNTTPAFGSTASAGASLFSTPFASGAVAGSGASFGAASKSSRPKSRTTRR